MQSIERYVIEFGPGGLIIKMRQQRQALTVGLISLTVLMVSWWFSPHGPRPSAFWALPENFFLIWCSFFSLVSVGCIIGFFYRQDAIITTKEMIHSRSLGPWRRTFHRPRPRKIHVNVLPMSSSTGRPVFPFQLFFVDEEGRICEFCVEFQSSRSVDRFLPVVRSVLDLEVEDSR